MASEYTLPSQVLSPTLGSVSCSVLECATHTSPPLCVVRGFTWASSSCRSSCVTIMSSILSLAANTAGASGRRDQVPVSHLRSHDSHAHRGAAVLEVVDLHFRSHRLDHGTTQNAYYGQRFDYGDLFNEVPSHGGDGVDGVPRTILVAIDCWMLRVLTLQFVFAHLPSTKVRLMI
ncbi:hypothetical protein FOPE_10795 [Fonsecaea pedrosoi]|nr:hypothetical protein FOPE_10795 [Fonsecaea pedrosoi]